MTTADVPVRNALWPAAEEVASALRRSVFVVRSRAGAGSATAWRADGLLATNSHVVRGERAQVEAADGRVFDARLVARDAARDLALLHVDGAAVTPVVTRDPATVRVGEVVLAVGNPWGRKGEVTLGIIASVGRPPVGMPRPPQRDAIYADVNLAPGNSGGPLADAQGRVIGINSMIVGGMAVAVPSTAVDALAAGKREQRGMLGVVVVPVAVPAVGAGLLLTEVRTGSAAEQAGLILGDVILGVDGERGLDVIAGRITHLSAGQTLHLELLRGGKPLTLGVVTADAA